MKNTLLKKLTFIILLALSSIISIKAQNPGLIISEFSANPPGTDSPYEYIEFRATKFIDFSVTPYCVVACNNGNATAAGWIAGGALSYGFSITTGTVNPGDVVYVGGTLMAPTMGAKLRMINTGTTAGDGFGTAASGGIVGNGGSNADGIAVFATTIASLTNSTVPVDAVFYGTAIGSATTATGGYQLPVNDLYNGGKLSGTSFVGPDPGSGVNVVASGTFDTLTNTYIVNRTWSTGSLTDGTSSVILGSVLPPANFAFSTDNQTVLESIGTVTANIAISNANANPSSVEVAIIPFGTALAGSDLAYTTQTVTFPGNSTGVKTLSITITDDALQEISEYFVIRLQNPVNATLTGTKEQIIFIKDNDHITPPGTNEVTMTHVSSFSNGAFATNSAEIVAHDPISQRIFVANSIGRKLDIIDFSNPAAMTLFASIDISSYGNINSVAVKNGIVACAIENNTPELDGFVVFFNTNGVFQKQVTVGALPDMVTFNHAGTRVLTANEGQPNANYTIDPEGSVSIIDISGGIASLSQSNVTTALFTAFNSQIASLKASGVRIFGPGSTVAQDMEPEYVTVSDDDMTAYVALQENNAFAYVDLATNTITDIKPLGFKDHTNANYGIDASSSGSNINIANWPVKGIFMPDGMTHFSAGGIDYLITANEGDSRQYGSFDEEATVGSATYSLDPVAFPYASIMKNNAALGKLKCTNALGDTDNDGDFDEIYTFGGRSFSIWNATTGALVYDSGDDLEELTAKDPVYGAIFNASHDDLVFKKRSASKGPEPEGVAVATIAGNLYAFVSMERIGGLMMFNINNPSAPQFVQYVNNRSTTTLTGDRGPEGIIYVKQSDSPTGKALIVLGNEVSSTVSVYEIACPASSATIAASGSSTVCAGQVVSISTSTLSGANYTWYNNGTLIPAANASTYTTTVAGNYSVKLDNVGCSINSNSLTVSVDALPSLSLTTNSNTICEGQPVTLSIAGAATYTWTDNSTNTTYSATPSSTTDYSVTGTGSNGCTDMATITITVNATPTVSINSNTLTLCAGETLSLTANGADTYTWQDNSSNQTYTATPSADATYSVTGETVNGCSNTAVMSVTVNPLPALSVSTSNTLICVGGNAILTASTTASNYLWSDGATTMTTSVSPTVTAVYTVTVNDGLCSSMASITQSVSLCTGIAGTMSEEVLSLYPNPFSSSLVVSWENNSNKETSITVYTTLGELIYSEKTTANKITIDSENWKNGTYFIKVNNKVLKTIKQD